MEKIIRVIIVIIAYFIGNLSPVFSVKKIIGDQEIAKEDMRRLNIMGCVVGIAKGFVASFIGFKYGVLIGVLSSVAVILGDLFPVLYKFKGGKGVATALGAGISAALALLI